MNKQTGKLLTLAGFAILAANLILGLVAALINLSLPAIILNLVELLGLGLITLGFGIRFLSERKILDLIITLGFGVNFVCKLLFGTSGINAIIILNDYINANMQTGIISLVGILANLAFICWIIRLFKNTPLGAIILIVSLIAPIPITFVPELFTSPSVAALTNIAVAIFRAAAAHLDYKN
jgi:hypothetical protein